MNPFEEKAKDINKTYKNWKSINVRPYDKETVDPYTRVRMILMNGTEFEAIWNTARWSRHCANNEVRRGMALIRRGEQQQQKRIACLKPRNETILEHTIGYEQLAVDLTAILAQREKNSYVKKQLDFALLEDFDHLYRYADLLDFERGVHAEKLVGCYTEIMPGRPTVNVANLYDTELGRKLYSEIAMIEEQHVTGYGCLLDPTVDMFTCMVMHEYTECYLYWSCMQDETDARIREIWQMHFEEELSHLKFATDMMEKYEGKVWQQIFPEGGVFPEPVKFAPQKGYVREVLKSVRLTGHSESFADVNELPDSYRFFGYNRSVQGNVRSLASHTVIEKTIKKFGKDYRFEEKAHPIRELSGREEANADVARIKGA